MAEKHVEMEIEWDSEGDPTTLAILKDLPENWGPIMLNLYQEGASDAEVMRELNLTKNKFIQLLGDTITTNFMEVVEHGRTISRAWWEREGRINLKTTGFQTGLWSWNMQNRFGWSQKTTEHSLTDAEVQSTEDQDLEQRIKALSRKL